MDLHTFEMKMVDHHLAELPGGIQLFKRNKFGHAFEGVAPTGVSQLIMEPDISVAEGACVDITFSESKRKHYIPKEISEYYDPE